MLKYTLIKINYKLINIYCLELYKIINKYLIILLESGQVDSWPIKSDMSQKILTRKFWHELNRVRFKSDQKN
jgi:hypothetical protein